MPSIQPPCGTREMFQVVTVVRRCGQYLIRASLTVTCGHACMPQGSASLLRAVILLLTPTCLIAEFKA